MMTTTVMMVRNIFQSIHVSYRLTGCCICYGTFIWTCSPADVMDDEFDIEEGGTLPDSPGEDEAADEAAATANGGLDDDEHISMRGELWSDENESFEDSEAGDRDSFSKQL